MMRIGKGFNFKIITLVVSISFLLNGTVYSYSLRVPAGQELILKRIDEMNKDIESNSTIRLVAHGDIHGELGGFKENLRKAMLIDEDDNWIGGDDILVQAGDVIDRGPKSREAYEFLEKLQIEARKTEGDVVRLFGNHELMLVRGDFRYANFENPQTLAEKIKEDVLEGRVVAAHVFGNRLFIHGGLRSKIREIIKDEIVVAKRIPRDKITLEDIAERLNQLLVEAVNKNDYSHAIFQADASRGGTAEVAGIFWADFQDLKASIFANEVKQIVGHTPERIKGAKGQWTDSIGRIDIDVGLLDHYGGNNAFLVIEKNKIKIISKNLQNTWEEELLGDFIEESFWVDNGDTIVDKEIFPELVIDDKTVNKREIVGGDEKGGKLEAHFVGEVWVGIGDETYKIWVEGESLYFQRYDEKDGQPQTRQAELVMRNEFYFGKEAGYIHKLDSGLFDTRPVRMKVTKAEDAYIFSVKDLKSLDGTTVEWNEPKDLTSKDDKKITTTKPPGNPNFPVTFTRLETGTNLYQYADDIKMVEMRLGSSNDSLMFFKNEVTKKYVLVYQGKKGDKTVRFNPGETVTVGRSLDRSIVTDSVDISVSLIHMEIKAEGDTIIINDTSEYGTRVKAHLRSLSSNLDAQDTTRDTAGVAL